MREANRGRSSGWSTQVATCCLGVLLLTSAALGRETGMKVSLVDELEPLYPDTGVAVALPAAPDRLDAARGTIAGVHLLVRNAPAGERLTVTVEGLTDTAIAAQVYRLIDVPVEINSGLHSRTEKWDGKRNPHVIRRAPFRIFEALRPIRAEEVTDGKAIGLAVQLTVPSDADSREYPLHVVVKVGTERIERHLTLKVYGARVPPAGRKSLCYTNWISLSKVVQGRDIAMWSEAYWQALDRYATLMAKGRQNTVLLPLWPHQNEQGQLVLERERISKIIKAFEKHGITYVEGAHLVAERDNQLITHPGQHRVQSDQGRAELIQTLKAIQQMIKEEKLAGRYFQHIKDEPSSRVTADYIEVAKLVHEHLPGIPVLEATVTRELTGAVDVWCPTVDEFQAHREFFERRKAAGDKVWVYSCLTPTGPWVNRLLDMERLRPVYIGWGSAKFGTDGFLHWGLNKFQVDPFKQSVVDHPQAPRTNNQLPAGDTHVVYPGPTGPCSSTRFEAHRIGLEDHALLLQLQRKDAKAFEALVASIFRGYHDYETSVAKYRQTRRHLLETTSRYVN